MQPKSLHAVLGLLLVAACSAATDDTAATSSAAFHEATADWRFLTAYWTESRARVQPYNGLGGSRESGPNYPGDLSSEENLGAWMRRYMPPSEPVVRSLYRNRRELGGNVVHTYEPFWRDMVCTKRFVRGGPGGCMVGNHLNLNDANSVEQTSNDGTVVMSITREGFVHFSLYQPGGGLTADRQRTTETAILDHELPGTIGKLAPHVCVNCHSGRIATDQNLGQKPDLGSVFREFEPSVLEAPPRVARGTAEQEWWELNQAVLTANAALASEAEGGLPGVDHAKKAIADHIAEIYAGLGEPASHPQPSSHALDEPQLTPPSWRAADEDSQRLWTKLVSPYCMQCHRHNDLDFAEYENFAYLRSMRGDDSLLRHYVAHSETEDPKAAYPYMPQSQLAFGLLERDVDAWDAINRWSRIEAPAVTVDVTEASAFVVRLSKTSITAEQSGPVRIELLNHTTRALDVYTNDALDLGIGRLQLSPRGDDGSPGKLVVSQPAGGLLVHVHGEGASEGIVITHRLRQSEDASADSN